MATSNELDLRKTNIESRFESESYYTTPDGKTIVCELVTKGGETVSGKATSKTKSKLIESVGKHLAFSNALTQLSRRNHQFL